MRDMFARMIAKKMEEAYFEESRKTPIKYKSELKSSLKKPQVYKKLHVASGSSINGSFVTKNARTVDSTIKRIAGNAGSTNNSFSRKTPVNFNLSIRQFGDKQKSGAGTIATGSRGIRSKRTVFTPNILSPNSSLDVSLFEKQVGPKYINLKETEVHSNRKI